MKSKSLDFSQIEWWIMTLVFLAIVLVNILEAPRYFNYYDDQLDQAIVMEYFAKIIIPITFFGTFYFLHKRLIPAYLRDRKPANLILFSFLIFLISYSIIAIFSVNAGITNTAILPFYINTVALYGGYLVMSYLIKQVLFSPKLNDFQIYNSLRLICIYPFILGFLFQLSVLGSDPVLFVFAVILPILVLVLFFIYYLIYLNIKNQKTRRANLFNILIQALVAIGFSSFSIAINDGTGLLFGLAVIILLQFLLIPLSIMAFKRYEGFQGQISKLTYQVDHGSASLDFLRSQINPHFLFNALNTLYASALIENAEKTADGVQKLGDMMRFMIHENQQDKIPLSREINYLRNYLDLQMLRFGKESKLEVDIQISEEMCQGDIAPMLLIPFVENAFKHGISLKEKSWIKLNLRCIAGSVHLDLVNSVHPEKPAENSREESGIGLDNVKKRLELVYPNIHQLNIIKNDSDFFVHLSIQLT